MNSNGSYQAARFFAGAFGASLYRLAVVKQLLIVP
jgi:hypothetical protein